MNLAEFPLAVLSTRTDPRIKTLEFRDSQRLKTGEVAEREWLITGADKFGLPTATDDDVILGLIRLTMDHGFRDRKVFFTRYELLKILQWSTEGRSYQRLTKSLDRLSGVRIKATNAFFDNVSKSYQTCNFGILDAYEIFSERGPGRGDSRNSHFIWSEMIFNSFKSGFIKKLDLNFYFSLESSFSRRLYRYLDKHFYYRSVVDKPLMVLAFEKLGLSRSYKYASSVKQQLEPALDELVKRGFLQRFEYLGQGMETTLRLVRGLSDAAQEVIEASAGIGQQYGDPLNSGRLRNNLMAAAESTAPGVSAFANTVSSQLTALGRPALGTNTREGIDFRSQLLRRGIAAKQAERLLLDRSEVELQQIRRILTYFDYLVGKRDPKISRNAVGFLYRAVENPLKFVVPKGFQEQGERDANRVGEARYSRVSAEGPSTLSSLPSSSVVRGRIAARDSEEMRAKYNQFKLGLITEAKTRLTAEEAQQLRLNVERKIEPMRVCLEPEGFRRALEGGIDDEIAKLCRVVDYRSWLSQVR